MPNDLTDTGRLVLEALHEAGGRLEHDGEVAPFDAIAEGIDRSYSTVRSTAGLLADEGLLRTKRGGIEGRRGSHVVSVSLTAKGERLVNGGAAPTMPAPTRARGPIPGPLGLAASPALPEMLAVVDARARMLRAELVALDDLRGRIEGYLER